MSEPTVPSVRTALVTGSTSGIGLGIARALAADGCRVVLNGLGSADQIADAMEAVRAAGAPDVVFHGADMTAPDQISDMMVMAERTFGGVDVLVNNAGIQHVARIEEFDPAMWDKIIAINLSSAFHTIRGAIGGMAARGWGRIINIASAHALVASPFKSAYVAAKHGIAGLTKTVALEHATDGVTCNAICPGYVLTPLVQAQIPDQARARNISEEAVVRDVLLAAQPTKRFVTTDQLGALAVFLASDAGASINGALLPVDGGWTAQ